MRVSQGIKMRFCTDECYPLLHPVVEPVKSVRASLVIKRLTGNGMRSRVPKRVVWQAAFWVFSALWFLGVWGQASAASPVPSRLVIHIAIADFDGDSRPDLASIETGLGSSRNTRYWIAFHLSTGRGQTVGITAPAGGLQIATLDVNGDSFPDVVVTTAWTNQPVTILLNDGLGNFTASNPSEFQGAFADHSACWTATSNEIRDAAALPLSRCIPGDCQARSRVSSATASARLVAPNSISPSFLASVLPFIGRAPPA